MRITRLKRSLAVFAAGNLTVGASFAMALREIETYGGYDHSLSLLGGCFALSAYVVACGGHMFIERQGRKRGYPRGNATIGYCARTLGLNVGVAMRQHLRDIQITRWYSGIKSVDDLLFTVRSVNALVATLKEEIKPRGGKLPQR